MKTFTGKRNGSHTYDGRMMVSLKRFITVPFQDFYVKPATSDSTTYEDFFTADAVVQEQYGNSWIRIVPRSIYPTYWGVFNQDSTTSHYSEFYDVYVDTPDIPPTPDEGVDSYDVSLDEELNPKTGKFENISVKVPVFSFGEDLMGYDFDGDISSGSLAEFNRFIHGGRGSNGLNKPFELMTSHSKEYYYLVKKVNGFEWSHVDDEKYSTEITFTCSPFKYFVDETQITISSGSTSTFTPQKTNCICRPIIAMRSNNNTADETVAVTITRTNSSTASTTFTVYFKIYASAWLHLDTQTGEVFTASGNDNIGYHYDRCNYESMPWYRDGDTVSIGVSSAYNAEALFIPRERFI